MEERTSFDSMVIERCMQHKPLNPLDKSYMRTSMLEARLAAMNAWPHSAQIEERLMAITDTGGLKAKDHTGVVWVCRI